MDKMLYAFDERDCMLLDQLEEHVCKAGTDFK
jgi:hypothetical protein